MKPRVDTDEVSLASFLGGIPQSLPIPPGHGEVSPGDQTLVHTLSQPPLQPLTPLPNPGAFLKGGFVLVPVLLYIETPFGQNITRASLSLGT